jgi:histone deacetylase 6
VSIHRFDNGTFYPGQYGKHSNIGESKGRGFNLHFPINVTKKMPYTVGDKEFIYACESILFPVIRDFAPDLMIISAGFDSAEGDEVGGLGVTPLGYSYMTRELRKI